MSKPEPFTLVFPHIAKTGGSTLHYHFKRHLGDEKVFICGPYNRVSRFFDDLPQLEEMNPREVATFQVVQGHGVSEEIFSILRDARIRLFVVLRHPVAHARSRFNHRRNEFARLGVDLDSAQFLSSTSANPISTLLLNKFPSFIEQTAATPYDQVVSILRKFDYVFTTEMMDLQVTRLMRELNLPTVMERRRVANEYSRLDVTDEELKRNNALDLEVFKTASKAISSGPRHNPFGFDREEKDAAIQKVLEKASSVEDVTQRAYTQLAKYLCTTLKAECALAKIASPPVALNDSALFGDILREEWTQYQEGLNSVQRDISYTHFTRMCVQLNKPRHRSTSNSHPQHFPRRPSAIVHILTKNLARYFTGFTK